MYDSPLDFRLNSLSPNSNNLFGEDESHASWSSLVGIVTAIIGNILISFALNIQRYAHIRIDNEYNDGQEKDRTQKPLPKSMPNYGTAVQQEEIAEERSRINAKASSGPGNRDDQTNGYEDSHNRSKSFGSDETAKPNEANENEQHSRKSYLKSPWWWGGIILMTVGEAGNFLAYGFAPASIVSPLGVVALISNCLIAPLMLKEQFRKRDFWGVLIAIGGAVTVVLSAKTSEVRMGPDDLWHAIKRWEFLTYIGITCVLIGLLMVASPRYGKKTITIDLGLVGLFGGYTALSTKGVASMLSGSLFQALTFPITYLLILILVASAIMQIRYLNRALSNFSSTQVIPTQFVLFTLSVIIGSAVLYRDFYKADLDHVVKFIVGCFLTFSGVWLITSGRKNNNQSNDVEDEASHDETIHLIDEEAEPEEEQTPVKHERLNRSETDIDVPKAAQRLSVISTGDYRSTTPSIPSVSVTPYEDDTSQNPWHSSTEDVDVFARPRTPPNPRELDDPEGTPYFTPSSAPNTARYGRVGVLGRTDSTPADPQTPTRASRAPSPPKADVPLQVPTEAALLTPSGKIYRSARGSISRLLPGPFLGPLSSSSLNAFVAESLLKGEGSPQGPIKNRSYRSKTRPAGSRIERNRRSSAAAIEGDLESGITAPLLNRWQTTDLRPQAPVRHHSDLSDGGGSSTTGRTRRMPSFSPTLSKFMDIMKQRRKDKDKAKDRAPGESEEGSSSRKGSDSR